MPAKAFGVFISPLHMVRVDADEVKTFGGTIVFLRDQVPVATFRDYCGWLEIEVGQKEPGSVLSIVKNNPSPQGAA